MSVKSYQDYLLEGHSATLPSYEKKGKILHMCPSCGRYRKDFRIVDCRHIAVAVVEREWACDACWGMWIRESGQPEKLYEDAAQDCVLHPGKHRKEAYFSTASTLKRNPHKMEIRDEIQGMKQAGTMPLGKIRKHCFTQSQWMEMHDTPAEIVTLTRGTKYDYSP